MTSSNLTPKQLKILTRIRDLRLATGCSPTMQELADELGVSKVTVFEHVQALIRKGALRRSAHKARSLELEAGFALPDEQVPTRVPLVGRIAAGSPIEAVENREFLDVAELIRPGGRLGGRGAELFALEVRGDSMIDAGILDGDFVICEQRQSAHNGETVVALIDNEEATLKRFYRKRGRIHLEPANPAYEPIIVDDCRIQGVVIGLVRRYT